MTKISKKKEKTGRQAVAGVIFGSRVLLYTSHLTCEFLPFITIKERMKQLSFKAIPKPFTSNSKHLALFRKKSYSSVSLQLETGSSQALFARYDYVNWHKALGSLFNHHRVLGKNYIP